MAEQIHIKGTNATAKIRHPAVVFGLVFLTLGIYYLVWYYKVNRELRDLGRASGQEDALGRRPGISLLAITVGWLLIIPPFVSFYATLRRIETAQRMNATTDRVNIWLGFGLYLFGLLAIPLEIPYAQNELNRVWRAQRTVTRP